jgi:hypothetical protein
MPITITAGSTPALRQPGNANTGDRERLAATSGQAQPQCQQRGGTEHALPGQLDPQHQARAQQQHGEEIAGPRLDIFHHELQRTTKQHTFS